MSEPNWRTSDQSDRQDLFDPFYLRARREAIIILITFSGFLIWTVGYCYLYAYPDATSPIRIVWGMPSWVFWGVLVPWVCATAFAVWFGLVYMTDDDAMRNGDWDRTTEKSTGGAEETHG